MKKAFWKSWTIWFNVLSALVVTAGEALPYLDGDTYRYVALAMVAGNLLLRLKTKEPVGVRDE